MKKIGIMAGVGIILVVLLSACAGGEVAQNQTTGDILHKGWSEIEALAEGKEVNIFMWGGDDGINQYIDEMVAPRLKEQYNITLKRTPMDTGDILQKLLTEKWAGQEKGTMDIIWINGDNFRNAKENELLYSPFTEYLPNFQAMLIAKIFMCIMTRGQKSKD
jgi:putative spermidine/putrescine transport system substrate-binding protein